MLVTWLSHQKVEWMVAELQKADRLIIIRKPDTTGYFYRDLWIISICLFDEKFGASMPCHVGGDPNRYLKPKM